MCDRRGWNGLWSKLTAEKKIQKKWLLKLIKSKKHLSSFDLLLLNISLFLIFLFLLHSYFSIFVRFLPFLPSFFFLITSISTTSVLYLYPSLLLLLLFFLFCFLLFFLSLLFFFLGLELRKIEVSLNKIIQ